MKAKHVGLQFVMGAVGALALGAVLAAVDFREVDTSKGKTQGDKSIKQSPAATKVIEVDKGGKAPNKSVKGADGSVKQ